MALLVGGGVDIDFDEADGWIVEVGLRPGGVNEGGCAMAHAKGLLVSWGADVRGGRRSVGGGRSVPAAELGEPLGTVGCCSLRLADDPWVDAAGVLDGH